MAGVGRQKADARMNGRFSRLVNVYANLRHVGDRRHAAADTRPEPADDQVVDRAVNPDDVIKDLELSLSDHKLLDEDYAGYDARMRIDEYLPNDGPNVLLGLNERVITFSHAAQLKLQPSCRVVRNRALSSSL